MAAYSAEGNEADAQIVCCVLMRCSASNRHGSRAFKDITIRKDTYNYELLLAFATKRPGSLLVDCSGDG